MNAETTFRITKKVCRCCGERKAASEFYPHPRTWDRLRDKCKRCHNAISEHNRKRRRAERMAAAVTRSAPRPAAMRRLDARSKWAAIAAEAAASE